MATPSFQEFEWIHEQPRWSNTPVSSPIVDSRFVQNQVAEIVDKRVLWWNGFNRHEAKRIMRLKEEYETNILIKG
jgi:hypothetical protein